MYIREVSISRNLLCSADMESSDLHRGQNSADNQRGRNEILLFPSWEIDASLACHDQRRSNDTSQHRKRVLETEQKCQNHRHLVIEAEEGSSAASPLHERDVWQKEEGIVVCSKESFPRRELLHDSAPDVSRAISKGLLRAPLRHNPIWQPILRHRRCDLYGILLQSLA
jgi:hypothetical protein